MRKIDHIFVHCTASRPTASVFAIKEEFRRKGWKNPGYHYLIDAAGHVTQLLSDGRVANGVKGYNGTGLHVAYIGGLNADGLTEDTRTPEQRQALRTLLAVLHRRYPSAPIMGHRDIWGKNPARWQKVCPCFDARKEYHDLQP